VSAEILPLVCDRTVCLTCSFYSRDGYCWEQGRLVPPNYVCPLWERARLPVRLWVASRNDDAD
jgi:hypothetical protein